jgi:nitrate reductase alpha subunit
MSVVVLAVRLVWGVPGLVVMAFVCVGVTKAAPAWERFRNPERFRGIDVLDSFHTPRSWLEAERAPDQDQYYPANSGEPPFKVPYKRWERRYLASKVSLARSFEIYDAAARAAGWQPYACTINAGLLPTQRHECWRRPNLVLTADFQSTDESCAPRTQNCGTTIDVELAERSVE